MKPLIIPSKRKPANYNVGEPLFPVRPNSRSTSRCAVTQHNYYSAQYSFIFKLVYYDDVFLIYGVFWCTLTYVTVSCLPRTTGSMRQLCGSCRRQTCPSLQCTREASVESTGAGNVRTILSSAVLGSAAMLVWLVIL